VSTRTRTIFVRVQWSRVFDKSGDPFACASSAERLTMTQG